MRISCAKTKRAQAWRSTRIRSSSTTPSTVRRWTFSRRHSVCHWSLTRTMVNARGAFLVNRAAIKPTRMRSKSKIRTRNTCLKTTLWRSWSRTRKIRAFISASWRTSTDIILELSISQWKVSVINWADLVSFKLYSGYYRWVDGSLAVPNHLGSSLALLWVVFRLGEAMQQTGLVEWV